MRILLIVACAAAFVFSAWSNMPTSAQSTDISIDPVSLTGTAVNLPAEQFDAF